MATVQERLQLKRAAIDRWTTREQLCLASAVACSGDQNWMSVSRALKLLCGNSRPADWFSQKSCAVQYGELLENVETPKRKKRTISERDGSGTSSSTTAIGAVAETPSESILRKLTHERISELRLLIQREREEYVKLMEEYMLVKNGSPTEEQLQEMLIQIEQEKEQKILEQQRYAQFLKDREERKNLLQKAWKSSTGIPPIAIPSTSQQSLQMNLSIESEGEDIALKSETSPLLTSLLKSPSPAPCTSTAAAATSAATLAIPSTSTQVTSNVYVTAPTITNLLTGNSSQVISPMPSTSTAQFVMTQNQPLTGPIPLSFQPQVPPSKSAPTLSMLLENKNKESTSTYSTVTEIKDEPQNTVDTTTTEAEDGNISPNKELLEVFDDLIPDDIDELADILTNNNAIILNPELLEEDDESILETVKSLIDEDEDIEMKEEHLNIDNNNYNKATDESITTIKSEENTATEPENKEESLIVEEIKQEATTSISDTYQNDNDKNNDNDIKIEANSDNISVDTVADTKVEIIEEKDDNCPNFEISDDSSDNTTLQALKEQIATKTAELEDDDDEDMDIKELKPETNNVNYDEKQIKDEMKNENETTIVMEILDSNDTTSNDKKDEINIKTSKTESKDEIEENTDKKDEHISEDTSKEVENDKNENHIHIKEIGNDELRQSPSESSVIIIQDDDSRHEKLDSEINIDEDKCNDKNEKDLEIPEKPKENQDIVEENKQIEIENEIKTTKKDEKNKISEIHAEQIDITESIKKKDENDNKKKPNDLATTTIVIDTDDDSPVEIIKEEPVTPRTKRDYSRKKTTPTTTTESPRTATTTTESPRTATTTTESPRTATTTTESPRAAATTTTESPRTATTTTTESPRTAATTTTESPRTAATTTSESPRTAATTTTTTTESPRTTTTIAIDSKKSSEQSSNNKTETENNQKLSQSSQQQKQNLSIKRLKERDGSESPLVDDDVASDVTVRTRRRYSSTPIFDSIPNSPASSDDKEYKAWKKSINLIYNRLIIHKNASIFLKPVTDDVAPNYKQIVHRPMDLQTIKKNIDNGTIRTTAEFQRDVMLMCQNAIMYNQTNNNVYNMAKEMWTDSVNVVETLLESVKKEAIVNSSDRSFSTGPSSKIRSRKSNRIQ